MYDYWARDLALPMHEVGKIFKILEGGTKIWAM